MAPNYGASNDYVSDRENRNADRKARGPVFLAFIGGASLLSSFGAALALARKKDPGMFIKGVQQRESGTSLAFRALAWGTLYAVTGVTVISYAAWRFIYVDVDTFRSRLSSWLPKIPKNEPQGRSEFNTVRELVEFVAEGGDEKGKPT